MSKNTTKSCLKKIAIAFGIICLLCIGLWLGFLWMVEVKVKKLPPSISASIKLTQPLHPLSPKNISHLIEINRLNAPTGVNGVISLLQPSTEANLLVLYEGGLFRRWDLNTQAMLVEYDFENANRNGGNFSTDGSFVITPGEILSTGEINGNTIWNTQTGERIYCGGLQCPDSQDPDYFYPRGSVLMDPSGDFLIEAGVSLISFYGWDRYHPEKYPPDYSNHSLMVDNHELDIYSNISRISIDSSGAYFAYALEEGQISIRYFEEAAGITHDGIVISKKLGNYHENAGIVTLDLVFDYTRTWLAALRSDELVVWDLDIFFDRRQLRVPIEDGKVVAFDRTGDIIAVGTGNGIQIYSVVDKEKITEFEVGEVTAIYISPDNRLLIWGDSYGHVHLWGVTADS